MTKLNVSSPDWSELFDCVGMVIVTFFLELRSRKNGTTNWRSRSKNIIAACKTYSNVNH